MKANWRKKLKHLYSTWDLPLLAGIWFSSSKTQARYFSRQGQDFTIFCVLEGVLKNKSRFRRRIGKCAFQFRRHIERLPPSFMGCIGDCMIIIQRNCGAMSTEVRSTEVDIAPQFRGMMTMQSPIHPIKEGGNHIVIQKMIVPHFMKWNKMR